MMIGAEVYEEKAWLVASTGGHLTELMQLRKIFDDYNYQIITERTKSNLKLRDKFGKKINF